MALTRPSSWDTYYAQNFLTDCDLSVLDNNDVEILNKQTIKSYSYSGKNSYVCETYPNEEATIVVLDWNNLSSATKTYLTTKNNIVKIVYIVGGDGASPKTMCIDSWELDNKDFSMSIKLKSLLMTLTNKCSVLFGYATYVLNDIATNISLAINTSNITDFNIKFIPSKITYGEVLQNIAITTCCGFKYDDVNNRIDLVASPNSYLTYNKKNVYGNIKIRLIEEEKDAIVCGAYKRVGTNVARTFIGEHTTYNNRTTMFNLYDNCIDFYMRQTYPASPSISHLTTTYNDKIVFNPTSVNAVFNVEAYYVDLEYYQDNDKKTIYSYLLYDNDAQKGLVQQYVDSIYAMDKTIEFECRIDPSIETLDAIRVDNKMVIVESIDINFNGGYRGKIRGRYQQKPLPLISKNLSYATNSYHIELYNPNPFPITALVYVGSTSVAPLGWTTNAHSTIIIDGNGGFGFTTLYNAFNDKVNGTLTSDITATAKASLMPPVSDATLILEHD